VLLRLSTDYGWIVQSIRSFVVVCIFKSISRSTGRDRACMSRSRERVRGYVVRGTPHQGSVETLQRLWAPTSKVKEVSIAEGHCNILVQQAESLKQLNG
jgi:hypothetical protein